MNKITNGWFTYDNYSVFSHVLMPYGFSISLSFKDYASGVVMKDALIGRFEDGAEKLHPGIRSWDGTYTNIKMTFRGTETLIESTDIDGDLYILATPIKYGIKPMSMIISSSMLWNSDGYVKLNKDKTELTGSFSDKSVTVRTNGDIVTEMHTGIRSPYIAVTLDKESVITTGEMKSPDEVRKILDRAKAETEKEAEKYSDPDLIEAYHALRSCMAWDTIYEPEKGQICTPVSRIWNIGWGGYVLFCWDTYFSAIMSTLASKELAYSNARAITEEITESGFIPNFGAANDFKSRDRSQPPVGSFAVLEIFKKYGETEFVESVYEKLLTWNRWFARNRMIENGTLCWGSNPYQPKAGKYWEVHNINDSSGAALESGLDNSPMYDDIPFDSDRHIMLLSDVGLTGLYVLDCESLRELALSLGKQEDADELKIRGEKAKDGIDSLWNDDFGIYCNRRADTGEFSLRISPTNFYALFSDRVSKEKADRMINEHFYNENEFYGEYIMPMIARNDPAYHDQQYWRGRIWAPTNYLAYLAMKKHSLKQPCRDLAEKSKKLILKEWREHGHVHENYNGDTGEGCDVGSSDKFYHWGALLSLIAIDDSNLM